MDVISTIGGFANGCIFLGYISLIPLRWRDQEMLVFNHSVKMNFSTRFQLTWLMFHFCPCKKSPRFQQKIDMIRDLSNMYLETSQNVNENNREAINDIRQSFARKLKSSSVLKSKNKKSRKL